MEEVRQILNYYKTIKTKTSYIKSYFEHINVINKKSSELLFRATQIPRDTSWQDNNLLNMVEMGERQRSIYDEVSISFRTLFTNLDELVGQINEEIKMIETDLSEVIEQNEQRSNDLEIAKKAHIDSWIKNNDPWLTDIKLKVAIKNMYNLKENNNSIISTKISIYNDKFLSTQDSYLQILHNFIKLQRSLFSELCDSSNFKISMYDESEKYFDAISDNNKEIVEGKIINAYEGIIHSISKELLKKNISIYKNIEPIKYGLCKIRRGLTGDWMLFFISVTKSKFAHLFDISNLDIKILKKYSEVLYKIKQSNNRSLVSIFDSKKNFISHTDERLISLLSEEIRENIDKLINNIYLSINLKDKRLKIDKDKCIITVDEKIQNGLSSLLRMNMIRIKSFTLTSCYELYFSMKKSDEKVEIEEFPEKCKDNSIEEFSKGVVIKIEENNPWVE